MGKWLYSHGIFVTIFADITNCNVKPVINHALNHWQPRTTVNDFQQAADLSRSLTVPNFWQFRADRSWICVIFAHGKAIKISVEKEGSHCCRDWSNYMTVENTTISAVQLETVDSATKVTVVGLLFLSLLMLNTNYWQQLSFLLLVWYVACCLWQHAVYQTASSSTVAVYQTASGSVVADWLPVADAWRCALVTMLSVSRIM